ncbi:vegetative cell wall protein gp1-like [Lolium rigidum]|uniref:vegetative cell wall protein gp1-like n=1 Tax=Lolium rigidum TaxID=89674 RepID=UPI001F5CE9D4|nr:vegetative cell wall protein gp1-like [Lolium rigidum]
MTTFVHCFLFEDSARLYDVVKAGSIIRSGQIFRWQVHHKWNQDTYRDRPGSAAALFRSQQNQDRPLARSDVPATAHRHRGRERERGEAAMRCCYVGKATKIFFAVVAALAVVGLVAAFATVVHRANARRSDSGPGPACAARPGGCRPVPPEPVGEQPSLPSTAATATPPPPQQYPTFPAPETAFPQPLAPPLQPPPAPIASPSPATFPSPPPPDALVPPPAAIAPPSPEFASQPPPVALVPPPAFASQPPPVELVPPPPVVLSAPPPAAPAAPSPSAS